MNDDGFQVAITERLVTGEGAMKGSIIRFIFALLFLLSGIGPVYTQCVEGHHRTEVSAEHETPLIQYPDAALTHSFFAPLKL